MRGTRTFIAFPLPPGLVQACMGWIGELKRKGIDARWVTEDELHITLAFLGELKTTEVIETCKLTTRISAATEGFVLGMAGLGFFPSTRRPRILWAGLDRGLRETVAFQKSLSSTLIEHQLFRTEDKPFHPHVTLGRINESAHLDAEQIIHDFRHHKSPVARVDTTLVMESMPGNRPRYVSMATCPMAKS